MRWAIGIGVSCWAAVAAAAAAPEGRADHQPRPSDRELARVVVADLLQIAPLHRPYVRYLAAPPQSGPDWIHAAQYIVNATVSQSRNLRFGTVIAGGHLLRYDLRVLAGYSAADGIREDLPVAQLRHVTRLIELWDSLAKRDPYYHVSQVTGERGLVAAAERRDAAIVAPHLELIVAELAVETNLSPAIAYRYDFFQDQVFTAAETPLGTGLYYDFLQLPDPRKGESDLDAFLRSQGIDYDQVDELGGERRVATFASKITSAPRRIDTYVGNAGRRVWITQDVAHASAAAKQHPVYSLVRFFPDAKELIAERANGLHIGLLFDKFGRLQRVAPPDVARDGTVPFPFPSEVQPGISCLRCHSRDGAAGLQPVENDVAKLLSGPLTVLRDRRLEGAELLDKLELLYGGQRFQLLLDRGRIDHDFAVQQLVDNPEIPADVSPVGLVGGEVAEIWRRYRYRYIDATIAWEEITGERLGSNQEAIGALSESISYGEDEDPAIAHLLAGGKIRRADFERIYTTLAIRFWRGQQ